jgi:hypothetical protein
VESERGWLPKTADKGIKQVGTVSERKVKMVETRSGAGGAGSSDFVQDPPATDCYGAETLRDSFLRWCTENEPTLIDRICSGPFWYTQQLYFDSRIRLYISHGTDTIMTQYDCCSGHCRDDASLIDICRHLSKHFADTSTPGV